MIEGVVNKKYYVIKANNNDDGDIILKLTSIDVLVGVVTENYDGEKLKQEDYYFKVYIKGKSVSVQCNNIFDEFNKLKEALLNA